MCWSAQVSFWFGCLDLACVGVLSGFWWWHHFYRMRLSQPHNCNDNDDIWRSPPHEHDEQRGTKLQSFAGTYAFLLASIAGQEWAQYATWKRIEGTARSSLLDPCLPPLCSTTSDVILSLTAVLFAESIPLIAIASSWLSDYSCHPRKQQQQHWPEKKYPGQSILFWDLLNLCQRVSSGGTHHNKDENASYRQTMRRRAWQGWWFQGILVATSVWYTQIYCALYYGPHHHLIWFSEEAVASTGGQKLQSMAFAGYLLASVCSIESLDMTWRRKGIFHGIVVASAVLSYVWFAKTLEASSIWCWSAFCLGIWFVGQEVVVFFLWQ